jgi:membrane carboxypeptidase/penicillin-binding protein PbpC
VLLAVVLGAAVWVAVPVSPRALGGRLNTVELLDRDGVSLRATRTPDGALHAWLPLAEMDPALLVAFVAAEDHYYSLYTSIRNSCGRFSWRLYANCSFRIKFIWC